MQVLDLHNIKSSVKQHRLLQGANYHYTEMGAPQWRDKSYDQHMVQLRQIALQHAPVLQQYLQQQDEQQMQQQEQQQDEQQEQHRKQA